MTWKPGQTKRFAREVWRTVLCKIDHTSGKTNHRGFWRRLTDHCSSGSTTYRPQVLPATRSDLSEAPHPQDAFSEPGENRRQSQSPYDDRSMPRSLRRRYRISRRNVASTHYGAIHPLHKNTEPFASAWTWPPRVKRYAQKIEQRSGSAGASFPDRRETIQGRRLRVTPWIAPNKVTIFCIGQEQDKDTADT